MVLYITQVTNIYKRYLNEDDGLLLTVRFHHLDALINGQITFN